MAAHHSNNAQDLEREIRQQVSGDVYFDNVTRGVYATDASLFQIMPQCVVVPKNESDILAVIAIANRYSIPITPRGGGTSLSGQTYGHGIVLDVSKYLDQVLEVNVEEGWARVQAGVVRDRLNAQLSPHQLHFAPDPATGSRATIGGMIGNNTCGTRSVVYGKTIDHVLEMRVALADGTVCTFANRTPDYWQDDAGDEATRREQRLLRGLAKIIDLNREEIARRYPKVLRRVSGYNLDEFVDGAGYTGPIGPRRHSNQGHRPWNLSNLIVGSEGTLGILLDAKIHLTSLPKATALCVVHFSDLNSALEAVDAMLVFEPTTVELLDATVMEEAKVNPATARMSYFISGSPAAVQIVEFFGETIDEATTKVTQFALQMQAQGIGYAWPTFYEKTQIRDVWETRKLGLGLISNVKGANKGRDFIEDACVPTKHLAEYIRKIQQLCKSESIDRISLYAHASVGVVHVVPALDLHDMDQANKMTRIATQAFSWVMEYGGSWSGEHGDGQLRGQFLPAMFGNQLYQAFRDVKKLFDPHCLMNPGKVIDTATLVENLRYQAPGYQENFSRTASKSLYRYAEQGGLQLAVEQCNGVGECRKLNSGTMCPSYMATRDEQHSTRGRANALRLAMSGQLGRDPLQVLASDDIHDCLSLCLACKACKSECPNAVDMAKLKSEVLQIRHDQRGTPLGTKLLGRMPDAARRLAGKAAGILGLAAIVPGSRVVLERLTGIDRRRPLPPFARRNLSQTLSQTPVRPGIRVRGKVVLFDDTYANYFEPHLGVAAIKLLEDAGFEGILANAGCCQRTRLSKGLVREAKKFGTQTMQRLDSYARLGYPILCLEPSCASALKDDLADLIDDHAMAQRVAERVTMLDIFLREQDVPLECDAPNVLLHGHCHQKAMFGTKAIRESFAAMTATQCSEVDSGCCGMAGSFGYEHYDISKTIGEQRLFPAARKAAQEQHTIVACGISCRHQLKDFCDVEAKHWVEVVRVAQPTKSAFPAP